MRALLATILLFLLWTAPLPAQAPNPPEPPRIDSVVPLSPQPFASDPAVIWYDDFDDDARQNAYLEKSGPLTAADRFGDHGKSLLMFYAQGQRGAGNRKIVFGDSPVSPQKRVRPGTVFNEIYWRIYVKHQRGWTGGGPAKLSRATSFTSPRWTQAMISHVWSQGDSLTLDPATGVQGSEVVTTRYNDFAHLHWFGNGPASQFPIHSARESGRWVCVEARAKLNTPGQSDGYNALWIDGILQTERKNLNWRGSYSAYGINAVFLEAYWNSGSPVDQKRYIDEFVVSTKPIGPVFVPLQPTLIRTPDDAATRPGPWELEVAVRTEPNEPGDLRLSQSTDLNTTGTRRYPNPVVGQDLSGRLVWKSKLLPASLLSVRLDSANGNFTDPKAASLAPGKTYFCRVRQQSPSGPPSPWSDWHQPFQTP